LDRPSQRLETVGYNAVFILYLAQTHSGTMTASMVCFIHHNHFILLIRFCIGLIRWKIVIHAFIDGYSRFLLGIRAHSNNRASTVLDLFEDIAQAFGYPSRMRGDHGTENLLVAAAMEHVRGEGRGSYIWGKYVIPLLCCTDIQFIEGACITYAVNDYGST
jgi:hypothetical protein